MVYVEFMKNIHLADSNEVMVVRLISDYSAKKNVYSYYLDMMYVEFIKNIYLADSKKLMVDRLISVSSAKKRLIPTF